MTTPYDSCANSASPHRIRRTSETGTVPRQLVSAQGFFLDAMRECIPDAEPVAFASSSDMDAMSKMRPWLP